MSDKVKLDNATEAKLNAIAGDVRSTKHTLDALIAALGADVAASVARNLERDAELRAQEEEEERRTAQITRWLAFSYEGPRGPQCRDWLEGKLAKSKYGPLRDEDVDRFNLDGNRRS